MSEKAFVAVYPFYLILSITFCRFGFGKEILIGICLISLCQIIARVSLTYVHIITYDMHKIIDKNTENTIQIIPDLEKFVSVTKNSKGQLEIKKTIEEMKSSLKSSMILMFLFGLPLATVQFSMILLR
ncbi:hypothetical protein [Enterocloster citroniae]